MISAGAPPEAAVIRWRRSAVTEARIIDSRGSNEHGSAGEPAAPQVIKRRVRLF